MLIETAKIPVSNNKNYYKRTNKKEYFKTKQNKSF